MSINKPSVFIGDSNQDQLYFTQAKTGINTTNPTEKLQVSGNIKADFFIGNGSLLTDLSSEFFSTVAEMAAATEYSVGNVVKCSDYAVGNDAGVMFFVAVPTGTGVADGGAFIDGVGVQWQQLFTASIRSIKQYGAVGDGVTDNTAVFNTIQNSSHENWLVPDGTYYSRLDFGDDSTFRLSAKAVIDLLAPSNWFPRLSIQEKEYIDINKTNKTADDPSPVIEPGDYVGLITGQAQDIRVINQWGKQLALPIAPGDPRQGRTRVSSFRLGMNHGGQGDAYNITSNAFVTKPADRSTVEAPYLFSGDHNNVGMGDGQISAGSNQVTLYGWGDILLEDNAYQTVAMRGIVVLLNANGQNDVSHQSAPAYHADQFCYMGRSQGTTVHADIDVIYTAIGPAKAAFDCSAGVLVNTVNPVDPTKPLHFSALNMAEGHRICYNATPATPQNGYVSPDPGLFWSSYNGSSVEHTGQQNMPGLPTFANNADAVTGGLLEGDLYQTLGGDLKIRV